jgi:predicted  nucleic acid-binding Zn-ribbon protein
MKQLTTAVLVALSTMSACKSSMPTQSTLATQQSPKKQAAVFEMDEMEDLSCGEARTVWVAQIRNLQLENHIAELEGRPQPNRIAIAKLESKVDAEDMLRSQEESAIKAARILEKNYPDSAAALQDSEKTVLDSISVARRANASGTEAEFKAALAKMSENSEAAQALVQAYLEKVTKAYQADCEKAGGVFVASPTGSACKAKQ